MPERFPPLAPQESSRCVSVQLLQALPLGELCLGLLIGLVLLLA